MPLWQLIAIIVLAWIVAIVAIVVFMMGAARGRAREQQTSRSDELEPAQMHSDGDK